ncbi:MAG: hypothetical protein QM703_15845 [Gemmatales bacterium]
MHYVRFIQLAFWLALLPVAGCSIAPVQLAIHPVRGSATFEGKPATGARLIFYTTLPDGKAYQTSARVDKDGNYQLTSYKENDGAPAGSYVVMAVWPESGSDEFPGPDRLKGKYASRDVTPLRATIVAGENTIPAFQLK